MTYADPDDMVMLLDWMFDYATAFEFAAAEEKKLYSKQKKAK